MKARIYNVKYWINEIDPLTMKTYFNELLIISGFHILNFQEHFFNPIGYTALWLLGESHLAIHTFPEECKAYIELSSCNKDFLNIFDKNIKQWQNKNLEIA